MSIDSEKSVQQMPPAELPAEQTIGVAIDETVENQANWLRRNSFKLAGALFLGGAAITTFNHNSVEQIKNDVIQEAPWTVGGIATSESLFVTGGALMVVGAGSKVGNPLTILKQKRIREVLKAGAESTTFRAGLVINTVGALGTAAVVAAGAATALPKEMWPGAFGLAAADMAATVGLRSAAYEGMRKVRTKSKTEEAETNKPAKIKVRTATLADIDALADIDLKLFEGAYGDKLPTKDEVVDMLTQRLNNNPGWMYVSEINGRVAGFVTGYKTNTSAEEFSSWEQSTNNGTLSGKVVPNGRYGYVVNMTIEHDAVLAGAREMLLANLFANGVEDGIEYGYFEARMTGFRRWYNKQLASNPQLDVENAALSYYDLRRDDGSPRDPQLRMYEGMGFERVRLVAGAFEDDASMNYGVVFKANVPPSGALKKFKPARKIVASALRLAAKNPKVLNKVF